MSDLIEPRFQPKKEMVYIRSNMGISVSNSRIDALHSNHSTLNQCWFNVAMTGVYMSCLTGLFPTPPPLFSITGQCPQLPIYLPALFDFKSFIQRLIFVIICSAHLITRTIHQEIIQKVNR